MPAKNEFLALAPKEQLAQYRLLDEAVRTLCIAPAVRSLLLRGSLAHGTHDSLSDVDIVIGIQDLEFKNFIDVLDSLVATRLGSLLPGWRDTYIRNLGGLGYVYLVVFEGKLLELDIYVAPDSVISDIQKRCNARVLYRAANTTGRKKIWSRFIEQELTRPATGAELLVEILVLIQFIRKRVIRAQSFVLYGDMNLLVRAVRDFIRSALVPDSTYWGWYHLDTELKDTQVGRVCLQGLEALIVLPPIRTMEDLVGMFDRIIAILNNASPPIIESAHCEIDAYRYYLERP